MFTQRKYKRFYYPKGVAGFWSAHVNGPLCKYNTESQDALDFLDLLDVRKFTEKVYSMMNLFACTDSDIEKWDGKITEEEMQFYTKIGRGDDDNAVEEFVRQVVSAIANTTITIWFTILQDEDDGDEDFKFKERVIYFIKNIQPCYWLKELVPMIEELTGNKVESSRIV
jgi:hypothetical protein